MGFVKKENAFVFLVLNAVLWGSSYVWSKMLLGYLPRFSILFLCALGGLAAIIVLFPGKLRSISIASVLPAAAVSLLSIISNIFFMLALEHTSSSNTAFIVQTSVFLTPIMMALLERKKPQGRTLVCAASAMAGIFLITCDIQTFRFNIGDLLALCNAFFFSAFLVGLKTLCSKIEPVQFSFIHQATNTIGFLVLALFFDSGNIDLRGLISPVFVLLAAASILVSSSTVLLQSAAIKYIRAEKATIIYTLEPVAALVLSMLFIGERFTGWGPAVGCTVILISVMASMYKKPLVSIKASLKKSEHLKYKVNY